MMRPLEVRRLSQPAVFFSFGMVAQAFLYPSPEPVRSGSWSGNISMGWFMSANARRQLRQGDSAVSVAHGVVWIKFDRSTNVLNSFVGLKSGHNRVGVCSPAPVSGIFRLESIAEL